MNSKTKLLQPQEIEVFYIIPAIRKHLATSMKAKGLKQRKIAELLQLDEAAVSQYLSNKRGNQVIFSKQVLNEIDESTKKINDQMTLLNETQRILKFIRISGDLCRTHKKLSKVPETCGPDFVGCQHVGDENGPNARLIH